MTLVFHCTPVKSIIMCTFFCVCERLCNHRLLLFLHSLVPYVPCVLSPTLSPNLVIHFCQRGGYNSSVFVTAGPLPRSRPYFRYPGRSSVNVRPLPPSLPPSLPHQCLVCLPCPSPTLSPCPPVPIPIPIPPSIPVPVLIP